MFWLERVYYIARTPSGLLFVGFFWFAKQKEYEELIMIYHSGSSSRRHSHLGRRTGGAKNRRHIFTGYPDVMVPDE
jgi:hypothetical protein